MSMARHKKGFWGRMADFLDPQEVPKPKKPVQAAQAPQRSAEQWAERALLLMNDAVDADTFQAAATEVYSMIHFDADNNHVMAPYIPELRMHLRDAGQRVAVAVPEALERINWCLTEIDALLLTKAPEQAGPKRGEAILEGTDYPSDWDAFIGQEDAKEQLITQIASAKARGTRVEHTLIASGVPGVGKSTLATLLAYHAGVGLERVSGQVSVADFLTLARTMRDGDILFIDEIHTLVGAGRNKADWLLPFMTEGVVYTEQGVEHVPDIAIVGATTDAGLLPDALLSRFMVQPPIRAYTPTEGGQIALMMAGRLGVSIDDVTAMRVALAAGNNPRTTRRLLTTIRDLGHAYPDTFPNLERALTWNGLTQDGLTNTSVRILKILEQSPNQTCGAPGLQSQLGESSPIRQHEQVLLQRGLMMLTPRGRTLTEAGRERLWQENE